MACLVVISPDPMVASEDSGITISEDASHPPGPPGSVLVEQRDGTLRVTWWGTRLDTIRSYAVHRRCGDGAWTRLGEVPASGDNAGMYSFDALGSSADCNYAVSARDTYGNEGPMQAAPVSPGPLEPPRR